MPSDSTKTPVPVSPKVVVTSESDIQNCISTVAKIEGVRGRQSRRGQGQGQGNGQGQSPVFCYCSGGRCGLSLVVSCVTSRPFAIYLPTRSASIPQVSMDRGNFNGYNNSGGYPGGFNGSQGQQQSPPYAPPNQFQGVGGQGQQGQRAQGGSSNPSLNHYHGSSFNFFFLNAGAYDLNFRVPGMNTGLSENPNPNYIPGPDNQQPMPPHQLNNGNPGGHHGSAFGGNYSNGFANSSHLYQNQNSMNQTPQGYRGQFYGDPSNGTMQRQQGQAMMPSPPPPYQHGFSNHAPMRELPMGNSLTHFSRSNSATTLLSDDLSDDITGSQSFGSQKSIGRM